MRGVIGFWLRHGAARDYPLGPLCRAKLEHSPRNQTTIADLLASLGRATEVQAKVGTPAIYEFEVLCGREVRAPRSEARLGGKLQGMYVNRREFILCGIDGAGVYGVRVCACPSHGISEKSVKRSRPPRHKRSTTTFTTNPPANNMNHHHNH
jgi:hypothetical protein